ncbi:MAG: TraB/GumN family protein [Flavobacteriia bacterium]|nr:TraB/GumN family protein [Flavobacteriia bacterium]
MIFHSFRLRLCFALILCLIIFSFTNKIISEDPFPFKESSLLWKIENPNSKKVSYLFGTMHLIEKKYFVFPNKLKSLIEKSSVLVMELNGIPDQSEVLKYLLLNEGSFFDYFNEKQKDSILTWAKNELNITPEIFKSTFDKFKPFVAIQMATQIQFFGKTESYELTFENIAVQKKIEIIGLETIAQQMAVFDNLSKEDQTQMVMEGIKTPEKSKNILLQMQQMYQRQQIDSLYLMIHEEEGILQKKEADFLENRNKNWIPQIKEIVNTKKAFIAVGAGHLGGKNGLIRLLQQEGYTITPIKL